MNWKVKTERLQLLGILFVINIIAGFMFHYMPEDKKVDYQGKVVFHSSDTHKIKNGEKTELYLGVDFDNGQNKSIMVDVNTFYRNKDGQRIAFTFDEDYFQKEKNHNWLGLIFFIFIFFTGVADFLILIGMIPD